MSAFSSQPTAYPQIEDNIPADQLDRNCAHCCLQPNLRSFLFISGPSCRRSSRVSRDQVSLREQGRQTAHHLEVTVGATVKERSEREYEIKYGVRLWNGSTHMCLQPFWNRLSPEASSLTLRAWPCSGIIETISRPLGTKAIPSYLN